MSDIVYTTAGGTRFHSTQECDGLIAGQGANGDGSHYAGTSVVIGTYPPVATTVIEATWTGKLPCRVCLPDYASAWFRAPSEYDFGHEPVTGTGWFGEDETVCARCTEAGLYWGGSDNLRPVHVIWPCTSAIVLGLVSREEVSA